MSRPGAISPEEILAAAGPEVRGMAARLRTLVRDAVPTAAERAYPGWRGIGYRDARAGYFCGIFPLAASVRLLFEHGASLADPERLFTGGGARTRFVELRPDDPLPEPQIRRMLDAAVLHGSVR